jgi:hypothetical protein
LRSRFAEPGTAFEYGGHFWSAQQPVQIRGVFVQHWEAETCSRTVCPLNSGWFVSADHDLQKRRIYASMEQAMAQAAREHDFDMANARKLIARYGL